MKIGPRYKIARRLGAGVFDKTQSAKFQARAARKTRIISRPKSDFGIQLLEKQKARFTYGVGERQFSRYVKNAIAQKKQKAADELYRTLESRLDNVVYRMGIVVSRAAARQMVSHGHITVNGKKVSIASFKVSPKDKVAIREASKNKALFQNLDEKLKEVRTPNWIKFNPETKVAEIATPPKREGSETFFDINAIVEFYKR
ncbi:MAG TPA: 30S ribosomal protein S4 [Candidatus Paceibacterota bacterium]